MGCAAEVLSANKAETEHGPEASSSSDVGITPYTHEAKNAHQKTRRRTITTEIRQRHGSGRHHTPPIVEIKTMPIQDAKVLTM
jgi:hypothetical protein